MLRREWNIRLRSEPALSGAERDKLELGFCGDSADTDLK